jgi:hypothetical protein
MNNKLDVARAADDFLKNLERDKKLFGVDILKIRRECTWNEEYAIFVLQFDTNPDFNLNPRLDNDYIEYGFDENKFYKDVVCHLNKIFPSCTINHNKHCHEFEIEGPRCKKYFKKHRDELEDFVERNTEWAIFVPSVKCSG